MTLSVQAFWLPQGGNAIEEYEDAFDYSIAERCFAIADGATESSFAGRWAQGLVRRFTAHPLFQSLGPDCQWEGDAPAELLEWLEPLQRAWREGIEWERLPWFAEEKAQAGAFSSLLGFAFAGEESLPRPSASETPITEGVRWHTLAIGDSCLFQVRDDALLTAFPLKCAEQFGNRPLLLSSNPANNRRVWDEVRRDEGDCQPGDLFLMMTDALAHWFLAQHEVDEKPWALLCDLKTEEDFAAFVAHLRQERLIRNDDTTLLMIHLTSRDL